MAELSGSELFLKLYQEGKIDNLELAIKDGDRYDAGETTNYEKTTGHDPLEMYQKYSDPSEVSLGSGLAEEAKQTIKSKKDELQQKMKESGVLDDLDLDQTRLSDEDWLKQADERQLTADSGMFETDATYVDDTNQGILGKQFQLPPSFWDSAGNVKSFLGSKNDNYYDANTMEGIASLGPQIHDWQYGNEWQTAEDEENWLSNLLSNQQWPNWRDISGRLSGLYQGLKGTVPWTWGAQALNFMGGANRGPLINPATQQFMGQYNVGRNPVTGRMVGGPFAGRNLPGTSMFGSTTPQEMAQKWLQKYGKVDYTTADQIAKKKQALDIASGNTNLPPTEKISTGGDADPGTGFGGPSPGTGRLSSGMTTGQHAAFRGEQGGLATLWPRY